MKKIIIALMVALFLCIASLSWATGTCTMSMSKYPGVLNMRTVTFVCTGDSANGGYPATSTSAATTFSKADFVGYWVSEVRTSPGAVAPTNGTAVVLNTTSPALASLPAMDILAGKGVCSSTVMKLFRPAGDQTANAGVYGGISLNNDISLTITGNSVNSAKVVVEVFLWKQ